MGIATMEFLQVCCLSVVLIAIVYITGTSETYNSTSNGTPNNNTASNNQTSGGYGPGGIVDDNEAKRIAQNCSDHTKKPLNEGKNPYTICACLKKNKYPGFKGKFFEECCVELYRKGDDLVYNSRETFSSCLRSFKNILKPSAALYAFVLIFIIIVNELLAAYAV